ncbi:MAG: M10 family metallopeptidase C-terminal domain-containing protein [Rhodobacter sp.]|nr:M10 family metallopeptidase C-terminal domain-containing protein [Rhodobacter sp.]
MTLVITTVTNTVGTNLNLAANQDIYVAPSALVASQEGYGILADEGGHAIDIYGAVYGEPAGIRLEDIADSIGNSRILVGVGASVAGRAIGIQSLSSSQSISVAGLVTGNDGIVHSGGTFSLSNSGSIIGSFGDGLNVDSSSGNIVNTGLIESTFFGSGVILDNSTTTGSFAPTLRNFGTIRAQFTAILGDSSNRDTILNYGAVIGDIQVQGENDYVLNAGTVEGKVLLGFGNDIYDGRGGTVSERVDGGAGDDTYIIDDPTILLVESVFSGTDTVQSAVSYTLADNFEILELIGSDNTGGTGNSEANFLIGNAGRNQLFGLDGNDDINGKQGDDYLDGGKGNDTMAGGSGNDDIFGRRGADLIVGGQGDDSLRGNRGDDTIQGQDGDDRILGGHGADTLNGGAGADQFVYRTVSDSTMATPDVITDFEVGTDKLDLSSLVSDPITLDLLGVFTGTGPSLRSAEVGGDTRVNIDVDGDGVADMRIVLAGTTGLTEADFIL